jgi:hypothetical protein
MENLSEEEKIRRGIIICPVRNELLNEMHELSKRLSEIAGRMIEVVPVEPVHLEPMRQEAQAIRERAIKAREELLIHYAEHGCLNGHGPDLSVYPARTVRTFPVPVRIP